jgi:adenylyltransferase and sulfurtransferase
VVACGDGGIIGPVVGVMGVLQAVEAIRLIVAGLSVADTTMSEFEEVGKRDGVPSPTLLIFSSSNPSPFRQVRLRTRRPDCFACSVKATLTKKSLTSGSLDYVAFCGEVAPVKILSPEERISAKEFSHLHGSGEKGHVLLDVREKVQFDICSIPGSINIPFSVIQSFPVVPSSDHDDVDGGEDPIGNGQGPEWLPEEVRNVVDVNKRIYVVCRLGNDSQVVARRLKESWLGKGKGKEKFIGDIKGGLRAWREEVDGDWPDY